MRKLATVSAFATVALAFSAAFFPDAPTLAAGPPNDAATQPHSIELHPKDFASTNEYVSILVIPPVNGRPARVKFKECSEMSEEKFAQSEPNCKDRGALDGYDLALVQAEGKKSRTNKGLFALQVGGETGMAIGAGYAPGFVGEAFGGALAALNIDSETGFQRVRRRRSEETIARAADGTTPVLVTKRSSRDLSNDLLGLVKNLEKSRKKLDQQIAAPADAPASVVNAERADPPPRGDSESGVAEPKGATTGDAAAKAPF